MPQNGLSHDQKRARRPVTGRSLRRSRNRMIAGVAGGIAAYLSAKPTAVRWVFALVLVLSGGLFVVPYLLLALLLPGPGDTAESEAREASERVN